MRQSLAFLLVQLSRWLTAFRCLFDWNTSWNNSQDQNFRFALFNKRVLNCAASSPFNVHPFWAPTRAPSATTKTRATHTPTSHTEALAQSLRAHKLLNKYGQVEQTQRQYKDKQQKCSAAKIAMRTEKQHEIHTTFYGHKRNTHKTKKCSGEKLNCITIYNTTERMSTGWKRGGARGGESQRNVAETGKRRPNDKTESSAWPWYMYSETERAKRAPKGVPEIM